ncbi:MAG: hypothetical protein GXP62_06755 [Oligoflexia bacterium]|nr:hypothetical protein [Oligoflexia bacterium]
MTHQRLDALRQEAALAIAAGTSPGELMQRLASQDPVALAELVVGPRAPASPLLVTAALDVLPALESAIAPKALYQRLVALAVETQHDVLRAAATRNPLARWLVRLSVTVEGDLAGLTHALVTAKLPVFARVCQLYAEAGHTPGLVQAAGRLGRCEIAGQLAAAGCREAAALAVVRTLEHSPEAPVVAWAVAGWGPESDDLLTACVRHLRDAPTAAALAPWVEGRVGPVPALLRAVSLALPPRHPD